MKKHTTGLLLMLLGIAVIGVQIGATAKYQSSNWSLLLPVGIILLLIGMYFWYHELIHPGKKKEGS